jgi:hypothetical protein
MIDDIWRQNSSSRVVFIEGMMNNMIHNTVISGWVPHALIKMVYTQMNITFQTSLNERSCQMPYELCFPVAGLQAPAKVPSYKLL